MKTFAPTRFALAICAFISLSAHALQESTPPIDSDLPELIAQVAGETAVRATAVVPAEASAPRRGLDVYTSRQRLSAGFGDWSETGVRGNYEIGAHLLGAELATMRRFGESGKYLGLSDTYTFNSDWFASLAVGAGDGAAYLPRYRVDGFVNRKLLTARNLIATLGAGYYRAPDGHTDRSASIGATYYFSQPWIVQGEVRFNNSSPGSVRTRQQFLAATWGRDKQTQVTARHAWGTEGYQSIGAGATLVDFRSRQTSLALRHWLGPQWGLMGSVERYSNPFYRRNGATLGLFWQFP